MSCASDDETIVPRKKDKWYRPKNDKSGTPIHAYHPDIPDRIETPFPVEAGLKGSKSQYLPRNVYSEQQHKQQEQIPIPPQPQRADQQTRSIAEEKGKEKENLALYAGQQATEFAMDEYDEGAETEVPRGQRGDSDRTLHSTQYANSHPHRASVFHSPIPVAMPRGNRERDTRPPPAHKDSTSTRDGRSGYHRPIHQGTIPRPLLTPRLIREKDISMYERQNFEWKYTALLIDRLFDHLVLREDDEHTCALIMQEKNYLLRLVTYKDA